MDVRLTWTDCDKAGDYVVLNVLSPRDLVSSPDNMDKTVLHILWILGQYTNIANFLMLCFSNMFCIIS